MKLLKYIPLFFVIVISTAHGKSAEDCRSEVASAVRNAGSDGSAMMRAGDRALERCMKRGKSNSMGKYIVGFLGFIIVAWIISVVVGDSSKNKNTRARNYVIDDEDDIKEKVEKVRKLSPEENKNLSDAIVNEYIQLIDGDTSKRDGVIIELSNKHKIPIRSVRSRLVRANLYNPQ